MIPDSSGFCVCALISYSVLCILLVLQLSCWEVEKAGCLNALIVILMPCDSQCSFALPLGAVSWYAVYDCGIFGSYSLLYAVNAPV